MSERVPTEGVDFGPLDKRLPLGFIKLVWRVKLPLASGKTNPSLSVCLLRSRQTLRAAMVAFPRGTVLRPAALFVVSMLPCASILRETVTLPSSRSRSLYFSAYCSDARSPDAAAKRMRTAKFSSAAFSKAANVAFDGGVIFSRSSSREPITRMLFCLSAQ